MARKIKNEENPEATWFGYASVAPEEKTARVRDVFSSVAERYDLMNDLMSGGLHRLWKDAFVRKLDPKAGQTILDVAGGTGDIALRCAERTKGKARIIVCDINPSMLAVGKTKAVDRGFLPTKQGSTGGLEWTVGNAEELPFKDKSADIVCIAFGLRNVTRIDKALAEFARVLKPGGRFYCMEFSPGVDPTLKPFYEAYSFKILPWLGRVVAEDEGAYQYLAESIRQFPPQAELVARMQAAGFKKVAYENLMGGIVAIHEGSR